MGNVSLEFKVGLFTLFGVSILGYMLFVLSPESFKNQNVQNYYSIVQDAQGIVEKSQVKTNGVIVGKVKSVALENNSTRISIEVNSNVKIPIGSRVAIKEKGLLGDVFLEIQRAEDKGAYLENNGLIPPLEDQTSLSKVIAVAGSIGNDVKKVTETLAKVFGGPNGESNIESIVTNIRSITEQTNGILAENRADVRKMVENFEKTTETLRAVLGDRQDDLTNIVSNIRSTTDDLKHFSHSLKEILRDENADKINKIISSFDHTMQDVEVTAKNIRLIASKLERGEGTIGKLLNDDETLTEFEEAVKDIRTILAPATKLQVAVEYRGEFRQDTTTQNYFNLLFRTRPDKYYLIGFTDLTYLDRETISTTSQSGSTETLKEKIKEKQAIRYNAQFAKRWDFAQIRFGLFESTGGLASDFYVLDDRIKWSIETFDWNSKSAVRRTAHVKTYFSLLFFNHIYAILGIEDPTRYEANSKRMIGTKNYFVGAGLSFDDQDLKALFGTAALAR